MLKVWILIALFSRDMDVEVYKTPQACEIARLAVERARGMGTCYERTVRAR